MEEITLQAFGRVVGFGKLYDARSDSFLTIAAFTTQLYETLRKSLNIEELTIVHFDDLENRFKLHNLDTGKTLNLITKFPELKDNYERFLTETVDEGSVKMGLLYKVKLYVNNARFDSSYNYVLAAKKATHFVTGIVEGFVNYATFEYRNLNEEDKIEARKFLELQLKGIVSAHFQKRPPFTLLSNSDWSKNLKIYVYGDGISKSDENPETFEEALKIMKRVKEPNNQKVQIEYNMCDINDFGTKYVKKYKPTIILLKPNYELGVYQPEKIFSDIQQVIKGLYRFSTLLKSPGGSDLDPSVRKELTEFIEQFFANIAKFHDELKQELVNNRSKMSKKKDSMVKLLKKNDGLVKLFNKLHNEKYSPDDGRKFLEKQDHVRLKIEFYLKIKSYVIFLTSYDPNASFFKGRCVYLFHYQDCSKSYKDPRWTASAELFERLIEKEMRIASFYVFDHSQYDSFAICRYKYGISECQDVLGEYQNHIEEEDDETVNSSETESETESEGDYEFEDDEIAERVDDPVGQKDNYINIVIIGETGVGKSTFINALANYSTFVGLQEAQNSELVSLIASSFSVTDENFEERKIVFGYDPNEQEGDGVSKTQLCKSYVFHMDELKIRLIDTPGIGDTRGVEQDRINMEGIFNYISNYPTIHGICFLLKPNSSKLSMSFHTAFGNLFERLHKSITQNLVFVFTNSRSTFFRPGDTFPVLKTTLEEMSRGEEAFKIKLNSETYFCLDNEAFRFLIMSRNGVEFDDEDELRNFHKSWQKSANEYQRLIKYMSELQPYAMEATVALNKIKDFALTLREPLAIKTAEIQNQIMILENEITIIEMQELSLTLDSQIEEKTKQQSKECENKISDYDQEQETITKIRAEFTLFLMKNQISLESFDETSDDIEKIYFVEKLDFKSEDDKKSLLSKLLLIQSRYEVKLDEMNENLTEKYLTIIARILDTVNQLYNLPLNGKGFKEASRMEYRALITKQEIPIDIVFRPEKKLLVTDL